MKQGAGLAAGEEAVTNPRNCVWERSFCVPLTLSLHRALLGLFVSELSWTRVPATGTVTTEHALCARGWAKCFMYIISLNPTAALILAIFPRVTD